ncbi:MAG: hypothetical protein ACRDHF_17575, partial [Tepidiformaceae bacterium]
ALAGAAAAVVVVGIAGRDDGGDQAAGGETPTPPAQPPLGRVVATIPVDGQPDGIAVAGNAVWVANQTSRKVTRIDASTNAVVAEVPIDSRWTSVVADVSGVWVAAPETRTIHRIDPRTNQVVATVDLDAGRVPGNRAEGSGAISIVSGFAGIWVLDGRQLLFINPGSNMVERWVSVDFGGNFDLAVGHESLWVTSQRDGLIRVDPVTGVARQLGDLPEVGYGLAESNAFLWISVTAANALLKVDTATGSVVARIELTEPGPPLATGDTVWVPLQAHDAVARIDAMSGEVLGAIEVGDAPKGLAGGPGAVWVSDITGGRVVRIDPEEAGPAANVQVDATSTPVEPVVN